MTQKKQKDPLARHPQEPRVKIKYRKERQKEEEAEQEIKDYLPNRQPTKSRGTKDS